MEVKHTLVENKNNGASEFILSANGLQASCPFKQPIPVSDALRGAYIFNPPCSSICPLFEHKENDVILHCGSGNRKITIGEVFYHQETKAPLIKL